MNTHAAPIKCDELAARGPVSTGLIPAAKSAIIRRISAGFLRWIKYNKNLINRRSFQTLLELDDAMLNDIGVTKSEVQWANSLPLSVNAAEELNKISLMRRHGGLPK